MAFIRHDACSWIPDLLVARPGMTDGDMAASFHIAVSLKIIGRKPVSTHKDGERLESIRKRVKVKKA